MKRLLHAGDCPYVRRAWLYALCFSRSRSFLDYLRRYQTAVLLESREVPQSKRIFVKPIIAYFLIDRNCWTNLLWIILDRVAHLARVFVDLPLLLRALAFLSAACRSK